jgi:hypothetical protein
MVKVNVESSRHFPENALIWLMRACKATGVTWTIRPHIDFFKKILYNIYRKNKKKEKGDLHYV